MNTVTATVTAPAAPRTNPYVRTDGWDDEVAKINARKAAA